MSETATDSSSEKNDNPDSVVNPAEGKANSTTETLRDVPYLFLVIGVSLIGLFITHWILSVAILQEVGSARTEAGLAQHAFWRIWAAAFNADYLYLIAGIVVCLVAIHIIDTPGWNRLIPILTGFAALALLALLLGSIGFLLILDWGSIAGSHLYNTVSTTLLALVKSGALIAIILVETPRLRALITHRIATIRTRIKPTRPTEEEEEEDSE